MNKVTANQIIPYINAICKQNIKAVANNPEVSIYQAEKLCDKYGMDTETKNELLAYLFLNVTNKALKKRVEALEKELKEANEKLIQLDKEWMEYDQKREAEWNKYADEMQAWIEQIPQQPQQPLANNEVKAAVDHCKGVSVLDTPDEYQGVTTNQPTADTLAAESIKDKGYWSEEQYKQVKAEAEAKGLDTSGLLPF